MVSELIFSSYCENIITLSNDSNTLGYYTPHGATHFLGVEKSVNKIMGIKSEINFSALEKFLLRLCSWSHDVGMIENIAKKFYENNHANSEQKSNTLFRQNHDKASSWFLVKEFNMLCNNLINKLTKTEEGYSQESYIDEVLSKHVNDVQNHDLLKKSLKLLTKKEQQSSFKAQLTNLVYSANIVSRYHRRSENIEECITERNVFGESVRIKLLASIFRLADAVDVDRSRFSKEMYESYKFMEDFDSESRMHWMKSFIVSSIAYNENSKSIEVQVDIPANWSTDKKTSSTNQIKNKTLDLINFIKSDLEEDILSTSRILLDYGFPPIMGVTSKLHEVPAMEMSDDVKRTIKDLAAASSPNTSTLIQSSIEGLSGLIDQSNEYNTIEKLTEDLNLRIGSIEYQVSKRPCHEGLRKIKSLSKAIRIIFTNNEHKNYVENIVNNLFDSTIAWSKLEFYKKCLSFSVDTLNEQRNLIKSNSSSTNLNVHLEGVENIILYGCSDQAIMIIDKIIKQLQPQHNPVIHILECRTKTKYTQTNKLIYHDAYRYASLIRENIGNTDPHLEINIYPDVAIARILDNSQKNLILFGSNAILSSGAFLHSLGHLTVAMIAQYNKDKGKDTTVILVADGMKIAMKDMAKLDEKLKKHKEHLRSEERGKQRNKDEWLSSNKKVIENVSSMDIKLYNYTEDEVPIELVDKVFILDKNVCLVSKNGSLKEFNNDDIDVIINDYSFDISQSMINNLLKRIVSSSISEIKNFHFYNKSLNAFNKNEQDWIVADEIIINKKLPFEIHEDAKDGYGKIIEFLNKNESTHYLTEFGKKFQEIWERDLMSRDFKYMTLQEG